MNIKQIFFIFISIFITITFLIIIAYIFIPKYTVIDEPFISIDFNDNQDLSFYLKDKNNIKCEYSKKGIQIIDTEGNKKSPAIKLTSDQKTRPKIYWKIYKKKQFKYLKLQSSIYLQNIIKNKKEFPVIWLIIEDKNGKKHWELPHRFIKLKNIFGWKKLIYYSYIPNYTKIIHFIISQNSISGDMLIDNIALTPCETNPVFRNYRIIVFIFLTCIFLIIAIIFYKMFFIFWKQVLIFIIIIIGVLGPKHYFFLMAYYFHIDEIIIQKFGHFFLFFLFSLFVSLNKNKLQIKDNINNPQIYLWSILFLIAAITELIQYFTFSRNMNFFDWMIDSAGIILGIITSQVYINVKKKRKKIIS